MNFVVLVLGDVGRSPRMQYHTLSLANQPETQSVQLVGIAGEPCIAQVEQHNKVTKVPLNHSTTAFQGIPRVFFLFYAPLKVIAQSVHLFYVILWVVPKPHTILIQNPPCIPTFVVALVVAKLRGSSVVIDWHNLGYTILQMNLGNRIHQRVILSIAYWYERTFGWFADAHFCVTNAMKDWLVDNFELDPSKVVVLHDKSPSMFRPLSTTEKHELFLRIGESHFREPVQTSQDGTEATLLTEKRVSGSAKLRHDRPAIVVSSTSWTPDEDFGVLFDAIVTFDQEASTNPDLLPFTYFVVTGKGPQKAMYLKKLEKLTLKRTKVLALWLESGDYPKLLGASDLGVCLHTSSSKLDLPMKVIDMFGAGIPVCAMNYPCLAKELVQNNENGLLFDTSAELAQHLINLLSDRDGKLAKLTGEVRSRNLKAKEEGKWEGNWTRSAWPVLNQAAHRHSISTGAFLVALNAIFVGIVAYFIAYAKPFQY